MTYYFFIPNIRRKIEIVSKADGKLQSPLEPPLGGSGKLYGVVAVPERCQRGNSFG